MPRLRGGEKEDRVSHFIGRPGFAMRDRDIAFGPPDRNTALVGPTLFGILVNAGLDRARADRIHADTGLAELQRQLLHHGDLRGLDRGIGGGARCGEGPRSIDRGYDDNGALARLLELGRGQMQRQIGAAQVHGDRLVPFGGFEIVDRSPDAIDAGIGDHDIEVAEGAEKRLHGIAH